MVRLRLISSFVNLWFDRRRFLGCDAVLLRVVGENLFTIGNGGIAFFDGLFASGDGARGATCRGAC